MKRSARPRTRPPCSSCCSAGHFFYWYCRGRARRRRSRAGCRPAARLGRVRRLLLGALPAPEPRRARGRVEDGAAWLAAVARVADLPPPVLPSFGPFAVPPSSEIVACSDLDGERFLLVARVYPGLAAVARLAGKLADNPWLTGGEVREVREGRRNEVDGAGLTWPGRTASGRSRPGRTPLLSPRPAPGRPARIRRRWGIFPWRRRSRISRRGDYTLRARDGDLEVRSPGRRVAAPELPAGAEDAVLLAVAGPALAGRRSPSRCRRGHGAVRHRGRAATGSPRPDLPGVAVLNPPGSRRWALPARGPGGAPGGRAADGGMPPGGRIVALDAASLERAEALAAGPLLPGAAGRRRASDSGRLVLGLWVRPRPALRLVTRIARGFEKVPLVDRRQVRRWEDWETLLRPAALCERVSLAATRSPSAFRLRLHGCRLTASRGIP